MNDLEAKLMKAGKYVIPRGTIGVRGTRAAFRVAELKMGALPRTLKFAALGNDTHEIRLFLAPLDSGSWPKGGLAEFELEILRAGTCIDVVS